MVEGFEIEAFEKEIIDEKITLVATDFWYKNAFSPKDGQAPKYTKLLKKIVKENHREHPLTLYLAPLFAIFWRMNPEMKISVKKLLAWCDLSSEGKYKLRDLRELIATLDFMKHSEYLGQWSHNGSSTDLEKSNNPFDCTLMLSPPNWLKKEMDLISTKQETYAIPEGKEEAISQEEFCELLLSLKKDGITGAQFASHIGVTKQYISLMKNGKRTITVETSRKIKEFLKSRK